jgi:MFS family permease
LALSLIGDSTLYAVLSNEIAVVGISLGAVGVMLGANRLVRIPANPLIGTLYDRSRRRSLFLLGLFLGILSTLSYSLVRGFWPLLASRLLWGIAWTLINVGGYTMVLDWSTDENRGRMTGLHGISYMVGLAISPVLGGLLTDTLGFRQALRVCALVSSIGLGIALLALPETRPDAGSLEGSKDSVRPRVSLSAMLGILRGLDRQILLAAYIYFVMFFVSNGVLMSTISLFLGQQWSEGIEVAGVVIGVASLAGLLLGLRALLGIVSGPLAGALSDRLPSRWPVARLGIVIGVAGFLLLVVQAGLWVLPAGVSLVALCSGALIAVMTATVGDLTLRGQRGVSVGGLATAGDIGSAAGPLVAYSLALLVGLRWVYLGCAIFLASGFVMSLLQENRAGFQDERGA